MLFSLLADRMTTLREAGFDRLMAIGRSALSARPEGAIIVVDIDRESLAERGSWPWPRGETAKLLDVVFKEGASAVALDIVFSRPDQRSPGSVARRLTRETGIAAFSEIAAALPDGDFLLSAALQNHPVIMASVLDPSGTPLGTTPPLLVRGAVKLGGAWESAGVQLPLPEFTRAAAGVGVASLQGDQDGRIRRVPLLVRVGDKTAPSLAAEAVRVAGEASGYFLTGPGLTLTVGNAEVELPTTGMLRLLPASATPATLRIMAADILSGRANGAAFKGATVFIGSSAPELGGLRPSLIGPLTPSVELHARAAWQIAAGISPLRLPFATAVELCCSMVIAAFMVWLTLRMRPAGAALAALAVAGIILVSACALAARDVLIDPMPQLAVLAAAFLGTSGGAYAETRRREATLRRRFEQHLAPGVVERIAAAPEGLKLAGEWRCITALFTDIEGFSTTAANVTPEQLILVLDGYFEGVASIIIRHGGMIDKFVGDAVHAFFNMPFDMRMHADHAISCAVEIARWTEQHRQEGLAAEIALGRTRIGIETGDAIVGDVGFSTKLDYTAHGTAVNVAARLEALNKDFGTAICVGPGTAAACVNSNLRPLGKADVRGIGTLDVYTVQGI